MHDIDGQQGLSSMNEENSTVAVVIPIIEEVLTVNRRTIDKGGYRIVKEVSIREEWVDEPLISQTQHIERRPIGRLLPTLDAPASRQEGDTLIVSIVEEVLVTEKRLLLKEELHIKQVETVVRNPVKYSLRSADVVVTPLNPGVLPNPTNS